MSNTGKIKLFDQQSVRAYWDEEQDKWFFSVQDVVQILSESRDVKQYIKKMRQRDPELASNWGTICTPVAMIASDGRLRKIQAAESVTNCHALKMWEQDGKMRLTDVVDTEQLFLENIQGLL